MIIGSNALGSRSAKSTNAIGNKKPRTAMATKELENAAAYARQIEDREELAKINALHHRLGTYVPSDG